MSKIFKFLLIFVVLLNLTWQATAYTTQFADTGETLRLHWKANIIPIAVSTSMLKPNSYIRPDSDVEGAIRRSLETWEKASNVKFQISWTDKQTISPSGKAGDGVNLITIAATPENILTFGNDAGEIAARTRIFFSRKGFITEADIVLNPYEQFSTDGSTGTYDLESTLTHEIGHLLGLEHSMVMGATMYEYQGKNGAYNLLGTSLRSLSEDDLAGIRALYGANDANEECCGTIGGKLTLASGKAAKDFQVWAEDAENGRVIAGVVTNADGFYRLEGLNIGRYKLYAQNLAKETEKTLSFENLGEIESVKDKVQNLSKRLISSRKPFDINYVGFNGQLSDLAVPVNGGKSYIIYVGGKNLDAKNITIGFNSPYLSVTPKSLKNHDYGEDISVVGFEVNVDEKIPFGEYSFFVKSKDKNARYSVGSLTVEDVVNEQNSYFLLNNE